MSNSNDVAPIFIVGSPRSGNTLLGCILNKHPDLCIFFEQGTFSYLYRKWTYMAPDTPEEAARLFAELFTGSLADWIANRTRLNLDARQVYGAALEGAPCWGDMLDSVMRFQMRQAKPSAHRWGDKKPQNVKEMTSILEAYPRAQFIYIFRDPRDTVASLSKRKFPHASDRPLVNAAVVQRYTHMYRAQKALIDPESLFELRYETLVQEPEASLRRLCSFLAVPYTPALLANATPSVQQAIGWADYKGWQAIEPQPAKLPTSSSRLVEAYLHNLILSQGYQPGDTSSLELMQANLRLSHFHAIQTTLNLLWKARYPHSSGYVMHELPSLGDMLQWLQAPRRARKPD